MGGDSSDIVAGVNSSKNAVENNMESLVIARDELEKSKQWWLDASNDNLHPIPASLVNVLIKGSVIIMDGTIGFVDTMADGTAVLITCGIGDSYCDQAKADVEKPIKQ